MTTHSGLLEPIEIGAADPRRNADVQALAAVIAGGAWDYVAGVCGAKTDTQPVSEFPHNLAGCIMPGYEYDFYNTIWITPNPIDLGNVVDGQTVSIDVWNAYFTPQLLSSIAESGAQGLTLVEPVTAPTIFGALENRTYTLIASLDGPAIIDADYTFPFPSDTIVLHVSGARTVVFAFPPNWASPVEEWYEWLTDMLIASNGKKQFRGLRGHPRWGLGYELALRGDAKRLFDNQLFDRQALAYAVPLWFDGSRLTQPILPDDTTIYLNDTSDRGFAVGQRAIVFVSELVYESFEIEAIAAGTLTAKSGLGEGWPAGTRIYPMRYVRLTQNQTLGRKTAGVRTARVAFESELGLEGAAAESGDTYRGEPLYLVKPNWAEDLTDEFRRKLQILDFVTNKKFVHDESGRPTIFQAMNWPLLTKAERTAFIQWLYARAGKYNGVWIPTHNADMAVNKLIGPTDSTIDINYCGYSLYIKEQVNRRDIVIWDKSGNTYLHRISSSSKISATVERISIAPDVFGVGLDPADIAKVSFLMYIHLASDRVGIKHLTATVAECDLILESDNDDDV
jgi:hypothetical protein